MARLIFVLLLLPAYSLRVVGAADVPFERGKIIERVVTLQHPDQFYALYLPSNYSPSRTWPVIYSFDPAARGLFPLQLQMEAAERYGFVLAASYTSKNGPWNPQLDAADAMVQDTFSRLSLDPHRNYFAGFSGGARVAAQLAMSCKCAAGVFLSGAGFPSGAFPARENPFAVFSAVGVFDFNYSEVVTLQDALEQAHSPHWLRVFEGPHQWAPAEIMDQAFAWFRVEAMKFQLEPRDSAFIAAQLSKSQARANSSEQTGDLLAAWREYFQIARTYDTLADVSALQSKADQLAADKSVRAAIKKERADFEEQQRLTADISATLSAPPTTDSAVSDVQALLEQSIERLSSAAAKEKKPDRMRVYRRAISGVFVEAMETGFHYIDAKNFARASRAFQCATLADSHSDWAWENFAVASALAGSRKDALGALRQARAYTPQQTAFIKWLTTETAFDHIRTTPEFQALLKPTDTK